MLHCFLKCEQVLCAEQIALDLAAIVRDRFNDVLAVRYVAANEWDIGFDSTHHFSVSLNNNKLDFIHPIDKWSWWAQLLVEDDMAIKYSCSITDEEYPHTTLKPSPETHQTFRIFLDHTLQHSPIWKKAITEIEIARLPDELKHF